MRHLRRESLAVCLLVALGALAFVNSLPNSFQFDDYTTIVQNGAIRTFEFVPSFFTDTSTWTISRLRDSAHRSANVCFQLLAWRAQSHRFSRSQSHLAFGHGILVVLDFWRYRFATSRAFEVIAESYLANRNNGCNPVRRAYRQFGSRQLYFRAQHAVGNVLLHAGILRLFARPVS